MNYIDQVQKQSQYAATPPVMLVYPEDNMQLEPLIWRRRAPTRSLDLYQGGHGLQSDSVQMNPITPAQQEMPLSNIEITVPWLLPYVIKTDSRALQIWIYTYLLQTVNLNLGLRYLQKIYHEGASYADNIQYAIKMVLDRPELIGEMANMLELYLPHQVRAAPLNYFYASLYWLRQFKPIRAQILPLLNQLSWVDLYLVTSNAYELYPARKLLSYYNDQELYMRFGRINNRYLSKKYTSKRDQLDSFVAMSMNYFGYIKVQSWSRPIQLQYNQEILSLEQLLDRKDIHPMIILRLGIELYSSLPQIQDVNAWQPLLDLLENKAAYFYNQYLYYKTNPEQDLGEQVIVPTITYSLETPLSGTAVCQLCQVSRSIDDFSLCGHPICMVCQTLTNSAVCPICKEHFTANNLNNKFLELMEQPNFSTVNMSKAITDLKQTIAKRVYKFDWSTAQIGLFGLKS